MEENNFNNENDENNNNNNINENENEIYNENTNNNNNNNINMISNNNNNNIEEEEMSDDTYLHELHLKLAQMKHERKEAEKFAKLSDNRLNMLRNEEEREWKKIQNSQKKANEKFLYLQNVAENKKYINNIKKLQNKEIEQKKINNKIMKENNRKKI